MKMPPVTERRRIVFDNKIPLTWLLSTGGTVLTLLAALLWNVAAQSNKLDQLITQSEKMESNNQARDVKLEALIRDGYESKRNAEILNMRIDALEKAKSK